MTILELRKLLRSIPKELQNQKVRIGGINIANKDETYSLELINSIQDMGSVETSGLVLLTKIIDPLVLMSGDDFNWYKNEVYDYEYEEDDELKLKDDLRRIARGIYSED